MPTPNLKRKVARSPRVDPPLKKKAAGIGQKSRAPRKQLVYKSGLKLGSRVAEGGTVTIVCRLESFRDEQARCWAEVSGARVPIDLPASELQAKRIQENTLFTWTFCERLPIAQGKAQPIEEPVPGSAVLPDQEEEIARLLQEAIESRQQGLWDFLNQQ